MPFKLSSILMKISFIKYVFQLILLNPIKVFIICCIKLGITVFAAFTSCCGVRIPVVCHIFPWWLTKWLEKQLWMKENADKSLKA